MTERAYRALADLIQTKTWRPLDALIMPSEWDYRWEAPPMCPKQQPGRGQQGAGRGEKEVRVLGGYLGPATGEIKGVGHEEQVTEQ